jgi:hypothetical protein
VHVTVGVCVAADIEHGFRYVSSSILSSCEQRQEY